MTPSQQDAASAGLEEAGFRALVEATPDILAVLGTDGLIRFVNGATSRMLGRSPDEMIGRPLQEFVHAEDRERALGSLVSLIGDPDSAPRPSVYRLLAADGQVRYVEVASVNRLADRRLNGVCVIARDVSERWQDESERIAQHERRGLVARVARIGIWEWNLQTHELFADEAVREIARQYPGQRWSGRRAFFERFVEEDRQPLVDTLRQAATGEAPCQAVARLRLQNGGLRWVHFHAQRMPSAHAPNPWLVGMLMDITGRKRLEQALLEAANTEQQRLGRELHDGLGQELTGISMLVHGMAPQIRSSSPALSPRLDRLNALLSSAIGSARALAHGLAPVSTSRGGLEAALRGLAGQSTEVYGLPVSLELAIDAPLNLDEVAGTHLYRIAQEALNNAVRHGQPSSVTLRLASSPDTITLEVLDDGCGTDGRSGAEDGMGLQSMAFRAASLHGTFSVQSRPEGGTQVLVKLPRSRS